MSATYRNRYDREMYQKTFRYGLVVSVIGICSMLVFYYLDLFVLDLGNTLPWRLAALLSALLFLVLAAVPAWRRHLVVAYVLMLSVFLLMISGIGYGIFADPSATTSQVFAVTIGAISVWFIVALVATSVSRSLVLIGSVVLIGFTILSLLVVREYDDGILAGFILSVFIMGLCALVFLYNQGRNDRERAFSVYALEDSRDQIVQQRQDLEEAHTNLMTFTHAMSHDLQGPLRRATSFLDLYERKHKEGLPAQTREYLDLARTHLQRGQQVVKDLLMYAQIGQREVERQPINLRILSEAIIAEQLTALSTAHPVSIHYAIDRDPYLDETLCWHLLSNLLSNAIKFTAGVAQPVITIGCRAEDGEDILYVQDNGLGFDESFKHSLGQPFKRLHDQTTPGTGIGLSIVRQVIKLHHGRFWADSPPGEGATFYCAFPAAPA